MVEDFFSTFQQLKTKSNNNRKLQIWKIQLHTWNRIGGHFWFVFFLQNFPSLHVIYGLELCIQNETHLDYYSLPSQACRIVLGRHMAMLHLPFQLLGWGWKLGQSIFEVNLPVVLDKRCMWKTKWKLERYLTGTSCNGMKCIGESACGYIFSLPEFIIWLN